MEHLQKQQQKELLKFFEIYLDFYKAFCNLEHIKLQDMQNGQIALLDAHVRREEAYMLKSKGLELERDKLLEECGNKGTSFRMLLPQFDGEEAERIQAIYHELSNVLVEMKEINGSCNNLTRVKLHKMERTREKIQQNPQLQATYNSRAQGVAPSSGIFSKRV